MQKTLEMEKHPREGVRAVTRDDVERMLLKPPAWLTYQVKAMLWKNANSGDIEDIIQVAIEEVILNYDRQGCRSTKEVHGYLKRIAHNKAIDLLRDNYVRLRDWDLTGQEEEEENEGDGYPSRKLLPAGRRYDPWQSIEIEIDVRKALGKLSPKERDIAELYTEEVPVRVAAKILKMSTSTVHRWWHERIVPTLRRELKDYAADSLSYLLRKEREATAKVMGW